MTYDIKFSHVMAALMHCSLFKCFCLANIQYTWINTARKDFKIVILVTSSPLTFCLPTCWLHPLPLLSVYLHVGYILSPYFLSTYMLVTSSPLTFCLPTCWLHPPPFLSTYMLVTSSPLTICLPTCWLHPPPLLSVYLHVGYILSPYFLSTYMLVEIDIATVRRSG